MVVAVAWGFFTVNATIQEGHTLVTSGPFRYLRHPHYLGIVVFFAGISLVFRAGSGLLISAAPAAVPAWCIHDDETGCVPSSAQSGAHAPGGRGAPSPGLLGDYSTWSGSSGRKASR